MKCCTAHQGVRNRMLCTISFVNLGLKSEAEQRSRGSERSKGLDPQAPKLTKVPSTISTIILRWAMSQAWFLADDLSGLVSWTWTSIIALSKFWRWPRLPWSIFSSQKGEEPHGKGSWNGHAICIHLLTILMMNQTVIICNCLFLLRKLYIQAQIESIAKAGPELRHHGNSKLPNGLTGRECLKTGMFWRERRCAYKGSGEIAKWSFRGMDVPQSEARTVKGQTGSQRSQTFDACLAAARRKSLCSAEGSIDGEAKIVTSDAEPHSALSYER